MIKAFLFFIIGCRPALETETREEMEVPARSRVGGHIDCRCLSPLKPKVVYIGEPQERFRLSIVSCPRFPSQQSGYG